MRPWEEEGRTGLDTAVSEVARGAVSDDLLRGGNPASLAAGGPLEIHPEIRLYNFAALTLRIAKHQVVLHGLVHGSGQIEIDRLIVRRLDVKQSLARTVAGKGCLLLLIHDEEVDV